MKKIFFLLLTLSVGFTAFSQTMPAVADIKLTAKEDYRAADTIAFQVANYILTTPSEEKNTQRLNGTSFLLRWMEGTPDFSFEIDEKVVKYFVKDVDLMAVYMAALTQAGLQNRNVKNTKALTSIAVKKFIVYINNSSYGVKINGKLKKLIEADQKGEL